MEVKEKIIKKASELYLSLGVRHVTMDTLATELGISKRTIYSLFSDKDDLVIQCMLYLSKEHGKKHIEIIERSDNVISALFEILKLQESVWRSYSEVFIEDIEKYYPAVYATYYSCKSSIKKYSASFSLLEKGVSDGIFRKDLRTDLVDAFIHESISIIRTSERFHLLKPTYADIFFNTVLPYLRGISTERGIELIEKHYDNYLKKIYIK